MKTIDLEKEKLNLEELISLVGKEPILLLTPDGKEFFISEVDDFEREIETLRGSLVFQRFLDERSACTTRVPLEEIEKEINEELHGVEQDSPKESLRQKFH